MANKPINVIWICSHCNKPLPAAWDGSFTTKYFTVKCPFCGELHEVKGQRLRHKKSKMGNKKNGN